MWVAMVYHRLTFRFTFDTIFAMNTVKLSSKGQIVIPKDIRKARHLVAGTELTIALVGDEIRLRPVPKLPRTSLEEAAGCLHGSGHRALSEEDTRKAIAELIKAQDDSTRT